MANRLPLPSTEVTQQAPNRTELTALHPPPPADPNKMPVGPLRAAEPPNKSTVNKSKDFTYPNEKKGRRGNHDS